MASMLNQVTKIAGVVGSLGGVVAYMSYYRNLRATSRNAASKVEDELTEPRMQLLKYLLDPVHDGEKHRIDLARISPFGGTVEVTLDSSIFSRMAAGEMSPSRPDDQVYLFAIGGFVDASLLAAQSVESGVLDPRDTLVYQSFVRNWLVVDIADKTAAKQKCWPGHDVLQFISSQADGETFPRYKHITSLWRTLGLKDIDQVLAHTKPAASLQRMSPNAKPQRQPELA